MFTRVALPTPFPIDVVNAYVAGRTVIDPGPATDAAWSALTDALAARDLSPGDVERVLVTHPHPDHFGLARRFRDAGADVLASPPAAAILDDYAARLEYERSYFADFFERCGMAPDVADVVTRLAEGFLPYVEDVTVDRELTTGDEAVVDGRSLAVDETTGHAPGELLFTVGAVDGSDDADADADADEAACSVVGDHVLPDHTPNPFLQPPREPGGRRPRVLPAYNDSLDRLAGEPLDRFLPGHGDPIEAPGDRIAAIRDHHESRTDRVRELLDGPTTPVAVLDELFPDLPGTERFAGTSEVVGHLDVLAERGLVRRTVRDGTIRYERDDSR